MPRSDRRLRRNEAQRAPRRRAASARRTQLPTSEQQGPRALGDNLRKAADHNDILPSPALAALCARCARVLAFAAPVALMPLLRFSLAPDLPVNVPVSTLNRKSKNFRQVAQGTPKRAAP